LLYTFVHYINKMAGAKNGTMASTPKLSTQTSNGGSTAKKQQSIAGFFQKRQATASSTPAKRAADNDAPKASDVSSNVDAASSPQTMPGASQQSSNIGSRGKENGELSLNRAEESSLID
jgi:DNA mismatch repair protein MSH6